MSYEIDTLDISLKAATDLSSYQYRFVKLTADNTVTFCGDGEQALGILQNKPTAADQAARVRVMGLSRIVVSETLTYGNLVGSAAAGKGEVSAHDKDLYCGVCVETGTFSAGTEMAVVMLLGPHTLSV